ncbi:uncharacterized protein LOC120284767 [Drosophila simulans]|uniref:GD12849 n=1 Tax=Drosophila simulans TaxID=7240 RepID=B4QP94_DROSI|nr:uncharacterized protein LOC120284767 [Drosophila simulans]EDX09992.1 GD12849 [Drosophila simulans]
MPNVFDGRETQQSQEQQQVVKRAWHGGRQGGGTGGDSWSEGDQKPPSHEHRTPGHMDTGRRWPVVSGHWSLVSGQWFALRSELYTKLVCPGSAAGVDCEQQKPLQK